MDPSKPLWPGGSKIVWVGLMMSACVFFGVLYEAILNVLERNQRFGGVQSL